MPKIWRKVTENCKECGQSVGKIKLIHGKIVVEEYNEHWGVGSKQ